MEILIVGDIHGKVGVAKGIIEIAVDSQYHGIIQVGDFGFWPTKGVNSYLFFVNDYLKDNNMWMWVIDGNHDFPGKDVDDPSGYRSWQISKENMFEPGIHWIPRNSVMDIDGHSVAFIGGAISVDRSWTEPVGNWFPEEALTDIDVADAQAIGEIDILISHDRKGIPPHFRQLNFDEQTRISLHQQNLRWHEIYTKLNPKIHFHGHFHDKYESFDEEWPGCHTIGLGAEDWSSFTGFNFETLELTHPTFE